MNGHWFVKMLPRADIFHTSIIVEPSTHSWNSWFYVLLNWAKLVCVNVCIKFVQTKFIFTKRLLQILLKRTAVATFDSSISYSPRTRIYICIRSTCATWFIQDAQQIGKGKRKWGCALWGITMFCLRRLLEFICTLCCLELKHVWIFHICSR